VVLVVFLLQPPCIATFQVLLYHNSIITASHKFVFSTLFVTQVWTCKELPNKVHTTPRVEKKDFAFGVWSFIVLGLVLRNGCNVDFDDGIYGQLSAKGRWELTEVLKSKPVSWAHGYCITRWWKGENRWIASGPVIFFNYRVHILVWTAVWVQIEYTFLKKVWRGSLTGHSTRFKAKTYGFKIELAVVEITCS
jgi:hypothetical protein